MEYQMELQAVEVRAVWEAPAITEYDAKAEIQGVPPIGPLESGFFTS